MSDERANNGLPGMTGLRIILEGRGAFDDLAEDPGWATLERVAVIDKITAEGRAEVSLLIRLESGQYVMARTTLRLFNTAAKAMTARCPDDGE